MIGNFLNLITNYYGGSRGDLKKNSTFERFFGFIRQKTERYRKRFRTCTSELRNRETVTRLQLGEDTKSTRKGKSTGGGN